MAQAAVPLMIASTVAGASGAMQQGSASKASAYSAATQLETAAGQDRATAQRQAIDQRRQARLLSSKLQARAGGDSGAGIINLDTGITGEGEYRALTALFNGEESARGKEHQAANARITGDNAVRAARTAAFSTVLQGASSMFGKYGQGGFTAPATDSDPLGTFISRNGWDK